MNSIPIHFLSTMIKIGNEEVSGLGPTWLGTGFLYQSSILSGKMFIVTNKHVIADLDEIYLDFKLKNSEVRQGLKVEIVKETKALWVGHPDPEIDIALVPLNMDELLEYEFAAFDDHSVISLADLAHNGIAEGAEVYMLSFPISIVTGDESYAYVRKGIISHIQSLLKNESTYFIIDLFTFPGNSGGPVLITYTKKDDGNHTYFSLLGVVRGYLSYFEDAVSVQSQRTRITFEDNSGLSAVEMAETINQTIDHYAKTL